MYMKYIGFLFILLFFSSLGNAQDNLKSKYRLSNNYAPHILENYVVKYEDGTTRIFNETDQTYSKELYHQFGTDNNNFWGLTDDKWCFGDCDSAIIKMDFPKAEFDKIVNLGLDYYLVWRGDNQLFLHVDLYHQTHNFVSSIPFNSIECGEFERTVIVSLNDSDGSTKYGCVSLETGKLFSDYLVDSMITCPRIFDEIALVKKGEKYQFYNFLTDKKIGKSYISYKRIPVYNTVLGIYENGVEIMDNEQIYNFDIGRVNSVYFENMGDFVYAYVKTAKGDFKIDVWEKKLINE